MDIKFTTLEEIKRQKKKIDHKSHWEQINIAWQPHSQNAQNDSTDTRQWWAKMININDLHPLQRLSNCI